MRKVDFRNVIFKSVRDREECTDIIKEIAESGGQKPGGYIKNWLDFSEGVIFAHVGDLVVGFTLYSFVWEESIIYVPAMVVKPEFQKKGILSKMLKRIIIKEMLIRRIKKFKITNLFSPIRVFFRTQNPILYKALKKRLDVLPNLDTTKTKSEKMLIEQISKIVNEIWPNFEFDKNNLILKSAYSKTPSLAYSSENIPWSNDQEVDKFFEKNLKLSKNSLDAFIVICTKKFF